MYFTFTILFSVFWYTFNIITAKASCFFNGNAKYTLLKYLQNIIYYTNIGQENVLKMDTPSENLFQKRCAGRIALLKRLECNKLDNCKTTLVDCRFKKVKVLMPLLRELEVTNPNIINTKEGIYVILPSGKRMSYLGGDAIYVFEHIFYKTLQKQITEKISLDSCKFAPITMNPELHKHTKTVLQLTNQEGVRYDKSW